MADPTLEAHMQHDAERFEQLNHRLDRIEGAIATSAATLHSYKGFFAGIVFICVALAGAVGLAVGVLK